MKITRNEIRFLNTSLTFKTGTGHTSRMDYIISMLTDQIMSSLKHLNRPEIWGEEADLFQIRLPLTDGEAVLTITNVDGNRIQILIDGEVMEEADEYVFASEFLKEMQSLLPDLLTDFKEQKYVYSQIKSDLRSDLNNLGLVIDQYER